jgi:regulator of cell morphogenesis and NO signaling
MQAPRLSLASDTGLTAPPGAASEDGAPDELPSLVDHIVERYHRTHLRDLPIAISLARDVERRDAAHPDCPVGLSAHLADLARILEAHQLREESSLFPLIRIGTPMCLDFVMRRMLDDHVEMEMQLMALQRFTARFRPGFRTPFRWQALSFMCRKLEQDLREHARLEHEVLYALLHA